MRQASSTPIPGERIAERYRCLERLGSGGMGQIYLVADELEHDRLVALKLLRPDTFRPEWVELLRTEFGALARLRHPGLVEVYELGMDPATGLPYFTMEALRGTGLLQAPAAREPHRLTELLVQILGALAFIHAEGFIHYDVKPSNVFVTDAGQVKLMDFALTGTAGRSPIHKGTPAYAAPEMIRREPVDRRLDLYSLGATLYHVLGGRPPFGGSMAEVLRGHLYRAPAPLDLKGELASLERFVFRLLAKRPDDRYYSAEHALAELGRLSRSLVGLGEAGAQESYLLTSRLIGREAELERLRRPLAALDAAQPARGRTLLVLVSGESGQGKSRLLRDVEIEAQLRSLPVAAGHCIPRGILPLQALREALRLPVLDAARRFPDLLETRRAGLGRLLPALRTELGDGMGAGGELEPLESEELDEALVQFLLAYAERDRLVLHLGDLQWADASTVLVVELLVRRLLEKPDRYQLLLYASFRPSESRGQPWGAAVGRLARLPGVELLELAPLGAAAVAHMVVSMLGVAGIDEALADLLAERTGGNPLFVEETVRYLLDWGLAVRRNGHLELLAPLDELPLPLSVPQALSIAFEGLSSPETELVQALAVIGRPAEVSLLADVLEVPVSDVRLSARALLPRHFLSRNWTEKEYVYALRHDQLSGYLYERLPPAAKARLHAGVAERLERSLDPAADPALLIELAVHFAEGISARPQDEAYRERAFERCVQAAGIATRLVSYQKAAELFGRAQRLAMHGGAPFLQRLLDVTLALVSVLDHLGGERDKMRELERAERLSRWMAEPQEAPCPEGVLL